MTGTNLTDEDKLEIFYNVLFESPQLDQTSVINRAWAKGDNTPEEITENEVFVGDIRPVLSIEKTSDKDRYLPGEKGNYEVKVTQTEKNAVARNLVLRDLIQSEDAVLDKESVAIYDQNGVKLDRPEIEATEKGYTIHTGMDLAYQEYLLMIFCVSL